MDHQFTFKIWRKIAKEWNKCAHLKYKFHKKIIEGEYVTRKKASIILQRLENNYNIKVDWIV